MSTTQTTSSTDLSTDALFTQYIHVVNRVIGENRDNAYATVMRLWDKAVGEEPIAVGVFKSDASEPHNWYTVKFSAGTFDLVDTAKDEAADIEWKVSAKHLENVVDDPQTYVEHPMKLDLDWMKTRVGLA